MKEKEFRSLLHLSTCEIPWVATQRRSNDHDGHQAGLEHHTCAFLCFTSIATSCVPEKSVRWLWSGGGKGHNAHVESASGEWKGPESLFIYILAHGPPVCSQGSCNSSFAVLRSWGSHLSILFTNSMHNLFSSPSMQVIADSKLKSCGTSSGCFKLPAQNVSIAVEMHMLSLLTHRLDCKTLLSAGRLGKYLV